jgi:hypothetical protein
MANKVVITVNGTIYEIPLPNGMTLRKQSDTCNKNQKICMNMEGNLVCAKLIMKEDPHGNFEFFDLQPCKYNKNGKVMKI